VEDWKQKHKLNYLELTEDVGNSVKVFVEKAKKEKAVEPWDVIWVNLNANQREGLSARGTKDALDAKLKEKESQKKKFHHK
jgi:hypothetical protein